MDPFAACYFCGAAVDTSLSERPVIPPSLAGGDADATLTLCSTCEGKLDAVVERVLETVDAADTSSATGAGARSPAGQGGPARSPGDQPAPGERGVDDAAGGRPSGGPQAREPGPPNRSHGADDPGDERPAGQPTDEPAPAETDTTDDRQTVSRLENSKVMRMLENRDFPVEREPFEHVVANAYDVTPQDVSRVIDMAIDRGLVADREGDLVKPD